MSLWEHRQYILTVAAKHFTYTPCLCIAATAVVRGIEMCIRDSVDTLALGVAIQDRCRLLAGDGCIRSEGTVCIAGYDLTGRCPAD